MEIEQVYREVAPKLQSYLTGNGCSYATACDIVQETFLRLWKRRDELTDDFHQVSGLVFTIARNYRNDLHRKNARMVERSDCSDNQTEDRMFEGPDVRMDETRPGEAQEEEAALRRRLKASLGRMPVELLETFALSRLGKLTVKDIASGTGASEANVKVRVHRAKEMLGKVMKCGSVEDGGKAEECKGGKVESGNGWAVFRAMMMLAAVDGEIDREELALYRELAERMRGGNAAGFDALWAESVKGMAYIGFLSEMLEPEELVREFVREAGKGLGADDIATLERMAAADGDYSRIERDCVSALASVAF